MKRLIYVIVLCAFCFMAGSAQAQEMTEEGKNYFKNRAKQLVEEFQSALSNIVDNNLRHDIRKENVTNLLKLFMGEGEPYDYYDEEADKRVHNTGVKIQTSDINKTKRQSQKLKRYIYRLYNPDTGNSVMPYSRISIEAADVIKIEDVQKVGNHYECIAYYIQKFVGYREGQVVCTDRTIKKIRCYIEGDPTVLLPSNKRIYPVKLGDIYVVSNNQM